MVMLYMTVRFHLGKNDIAKNRVGRMNRATFGQTKRAAGPACLAWIVDVLVWLVTCRAYRLATVTCRNSVRSALRNIAS